MKSESVVAEGGPRRAVGSRAAPRPISRRRKLAFILVVFAILGLAQEVCFRVAFPFPEISYFNRIHYSELFSIYGNIDDKVGPTINQIQRYVSEPDGYVYDHTLNLYGFRGPTFAIDPPSDRPRVVFIGDSFVEGQGCADDETIPVRFAEALGDRRKVEAVNLGVVGADLNEYVRIARDGIAALRPDAVFLVLYANDLPSPAPTPLVIAPAPAMKRANPWLPRAYQVIGRLARGLEVPSLFPTGPFPIFQPVPSPLNLLSTKAPPEGADPAIVESARRGKLNPSVLWYAGLLETILRHDPSAAGGASEHLRLIAEHCRRHQARLIVVYIPAHIATNNIYRKAMRRCGAKPFRSEDMTTDPAYRVQQRHLARVTADLGLPFLDLTDAFIQAERTQGRMYWAYDTHCRPEGYRLVAEARARSWGERPDR